MGANHPFLQSMSTVSKLANTVSTRKKATSYSSHYIRRTTPHLSQSPPKLPYVAAPYIPRTEDTEDDLTPTAGTYFMTIASLPLLRKSTDPRVINIASALGWTGYETRCATTR
jgi:hypothetical protein